MAGLDDLDVIQLLTIDHLVIEKKKVEQIYNKNVQLKSFKEMDVV